MKIYDMEVRNYTDSFNTGLSLKGIEQKNLKDAIKYAMAYAIDLESTIKGKEQFIEILTNTEDYDSATILGYFSEGSILHTSVDINEIYSKKEDK